jgi:4-deoxy-L-threo-5-hexosulose-uronate ketol-isomerase
MGEIRGSFLIDRLFEPDRIIVSHSEVDRASVGGAVPGAVPLELLAAPEFRSDFFAQRSELDIIWRLKA